MGSGGGARTTSFKGDEYVEETSIERLLRMFYTGLFGVLYTMSKVSSRRGATRVPRRMWGWSERLLTLSPHSGC